MRNWPLSPQLYAKTKKKSPLKEYAQLLLEELNHRPSEPSPEDIDLYLKVFKIEFSRRLRNKMLLQKLDKKE